MLRKARWMLVGILCVVFVSIQACTQETQWDKHMTTAAKAYQQGRYTDAERSFQAAVKDAEAFGPQDPRLATSLNNLAELYRLQGKYAEAEPLNKRALAIRKRSLGPAHPDVANSLNNLAGLYHQQGKYDEAEPLYKRSLAIVEKALGPEHPHVATSLENYAMLLRKTNREAEAARIEALAKAIRAVRSQKNPAI